MNIALTTLHNLAKGSRQESPFFRGRGGRDKGRASKKNTFFKLKKSEKKNVATKLEGEGGKALVAGPITFFKNAHFLSKVHAFLTQ